MADKLELPTLKSGYRSAQKLDEAFELIEEAFDNTLSRDGAEPNFMEAALDMNGNRILNVGAPVDGSDAVRLIDIANLDPGSFITWDSVIGKPVTFTPSPHNQAFNTISDGQEAVEDLIGSSIVAGANVTVSYNDGTGKTTIASSGGGGGGAVDWADITNKPTTFTPAAHTQAFSTLTDGQEAVEDLIGASLVAGAGITVGYNDGTGKTTLTASGGGGSGVNITDFINVFGGVGDGTTNNDSAFAAAEASGFQEIYLPQGRFLTTMLGSQFDKRYWGPGTIYRGTSGAGTFPNFGRYKVDVHPTVDPLLEYGIGENMEFGHAQYRVVNSGTRKNFDRYLQTGGNPNGFAPYFWAPATPEFIRYINQGGWSGISGVTSGGLTASVSTSVAINGGTTGWNIGDTIGFLNATTGVATDQRVLTGVGGGTISWSGAVANSYPAGTICTHGYRTMDTAYLTVVDHLGGGDCYVHVGRMNVAYNGLASQTGFEQRATGGLFGGEITLSTDGSYGTGWENQAFDTGHDTCYGGFINSYVRTNDTGGYGNFWIHDYAKMDGGGYGYIPFGLKPIDGIYVAALAAKTGLDLSQSKFSVAAVALHLDSKIALDAQTVAPGPSNGNGFIATTDGGMWIQGTTVSGTKSLELNNGSYRLRLNANGGLTTNAAMSVGSTLAASGTIFAPQFQVNNGASTQHVIQFGPTGNTYMVFDSATSVMRLYINGVQKDIWS